MSRMQYVLEQDKEVLTLIKEIDQLFSNYLDTSNQRHNQKIVNVGRAISSFHVAWVANMAAYTDNIGESVLDMPKPFKEPVR